MNLTIRAQNKAQYNGSCMARPEKSWACRGKGTWHHKEALEADFFRSYCILDPRPGAREPLSGISRGLE